MRWSSRRYIYRRLHEGLQVLPRLMPGRRAHRSNPVPWLHKESIGARLVPGGKVDEAHETPVQVAFLTSDYIVARAITRLRRQRHGTLSHMDKPLSAPEKQLSVYGFPDECENFDKRHPMWGQTMQNLVRTLDLAFSRVHITRGAQDKLVYLFGRLCVEDFMEILLLCYHGYGAAASKLVRSMYERAVTLYYLHEHPEEVQTFMDYHLLQEDKLLSRMIETFGPNILPPEEVAEVRRKAAGVKQNFLVPVCDHPDAEMRLRHTWSKLDFVAMTKKAGALGTLVVPGYFLPLRHAHPTFGGLTERLEIVDGVIAVNPEPQAELADRSLMTAHNCILVALEVQKNYFRIDGLEEPLQVCLRDWVRVWSPDSPLLKESV